MKFDFGVGVGGSRMMFFLFGVKNPFDILNLCFGGHPEVRSPQIVNVLHLYHFKLPFCLAHCLNDYLLLNHNSSHYFIIPIQETPYFIIYSFIIYSCSPLSKSTAASLKVEAK